MQKQELRQKMLQKRAALKNEEVAVLSAILEGKLHDLVYVQSASCIMAYYPHRNEPDLLAFMDQCLNRGIKVLLPHVTGEGSMIPVNYNIGCSMKNNLYGIPEPDMIEGECAEPDVIIVPGIAFDLSLHRIGFGGGYYDRFLCSSNAVKIGVCFDFQVVDTIDTDGHDISMDMIVTEKRILGDE